MSPMNDNALSRACRLHERAVVARAQGEFAKTESPSLNALKLGKTPGGPEHPVTVDPAALDPATATGLGEPGTDRGLVCRGLQGSPVSIAPEALAQLQELYDRGRMLQAYR